MRNRAIAALLVILATVSSPHAGSESRSLTILYTSSSQGQIRSCNCTKFRFGGYGREMTLLKSIRAQCPDSILIEGGDLVEWTGIQARLKCKVAGAAMKLLGYDAIVPGENEVGRPGDRGIERFDPKSVPIVCANYLGSPSGGGQSETNPATRPYVLIKTGSGLTVGLIGLLSESVGRVFQREDFRNSVGDPVAALRRVLPSVRSKCGLIVVVYHGTAAEAGKLAALPGVDLLLATHRGRGEILFPVKPDNEIEAPVNVADGVTIIGAETHENWSLGRVDLTLSPAGKIESAKHRLTYLDRRYQEDPEMVAVYEDYNLKVKEAVLSQSNEFKSKAEEMMTKRGLNLAEMRKRLRKSPFATAEQCKTCHAGIYESWSKTRHAQAMATLEKTHQEFDPECVSCHATGALARNGFANKRDTPELANVQCEACHGPGLAHMEKTSRACATINESTCRSCHTDERTPDFDFETFREKIKH